VRIIERLPVRVYEGDWSKDIMDICKETDHPFIQEKYDDALRRKDGDENRAKKMYISQMNLWGYRGFTFQDTEWINEPNIERKREIYNALYRKSA